MFYATIVYIMPQLYNSLHGNGSMRFILSFFLIFIFACTAAHSSKSYKGVFSLKIRGLPIGTLSFLGTHENSNYKISGELKSGGIFKFINKQRYKATVTGTSANNNFKPVIYNELRNKKGKKSSAKLAYKNGIPQIREYDPPRQIKEGSVNPNTQGGTVDPLTALYVTLRDNYSLKPCQLELEVFDGKRKSQVRLFPELKKRGDLIMCIGEYKRLAGFSKKDMDEKIRFPFNIFYQKTNEHTYYVKKLVIETIYGTAILTRKAR